MSTTRSAQGADLVDPVLDDHDAGAAASPASRRSVAEHLLRPDRVQVGQRLVEDEDPRPHGQRGRDRGALLLPAGQRDRRPPAAARPARSRPGTSPPGRRSRAGGRARFSGPNATSDCTVWLISWRFGFWNTMPTSWDASCGGSPLSGRPPNITRPAQFAVHPGRDQPAQRQRQRRLAAAGGPGDQHHLARRDAEVDVPQRRPDRAVVGERDVRRAAAQLRLLALMLPVLPQHHRPQQRGHDGQEARDGDQHRGPVVEQDVRVAEQRVLVAVGPVVVGQPVGQAQDRAAGRW